MKQILQDTWFKQWFIRKNEILHARFIEYAWILRHLNLEEGDILDVGCGASFFPLMLALQGYNVTAIDARNFNYQFPFYTFIQSEASKFKSNKKFDRITIGSSLEHFGIQQLWKKLDEDHKSIKNLRLCLKPNGYFLVTIPYGIENVLPSWRVYNQKRINELFPDILKQEYFKREGNFLVKAPKEEVETIKHEKAGPLPAITCLMAR